MSGPQLPSAAVTGAAQTPIRTGDAVVLFGLNSSVQLNNQPAKVIAVSGEGPDAIFTVKMDTSGQMVKVRVKNLRHASTTTATTPPTPAAPPPLGPAGGATPAAPAASTPIPGATATAAAHATVAPTPAPPPPTAAGSVPPASADGAVAAPPAAPLPAPGPLGAAAEGQPATEGNKDTPTPTSTDTTTTAAASPPLPSPSGMLGVSQQQQPPSPSASVSAASPASASPTGSEGGWRSRAAQQLEEGRLGRVPDWKRKLQEYVGGTSPPPAPLRRTPSPGGGGARPRGPSCPACRDPSPPGSAADASAVPQQQWGGGGAGSSSGGSPAPPSPRLLEELQLLRKELEAERALRDKAECALTYVSSADYFDGSPGGAGEAPPQQAAPSPPPPPPSLPSPRASSGGGTSTAATSPMSAPGSPPSSRSPAAAAAAPQQQQQSCDAKAAPPPPTAAPAAAAATSAEGTSPVGPPAPLCPPAPAKAGEGGVSAVASEGDRVVLQGMESQPRLNGSRGVVTEVLRVGGIPVIASVRLDGFDSVMQVKPCHAVKEGPAPQGGGATEGQGGAAEAAAEKTPASVGLPAAAGAAASPPPIRTGDAVILFGLNSSVQLNNQPAKVIAVSGEGPDATFTVKMDTSGQMVKVRVKNLRHATTTTPSASPPTPAAPASPPTPTPAPPPWPPSEGDTVVVTGLNSQKHLNGKRGAVEQVVDQPPHGRLYRARLEGEEKPILLRLQNLERPPAPSPPPLPPPGSAGQSSAGSRPASPLSPRPAGEGDAATAGSTAPQEFIVGTSITIHSLQSRGELNGKVGVISRRLDHPTHGPCYYLDIPGEKSPVVCQPKNMRKSTPDTPMPMPPVGAVPPKGPLFLLQRIRTQGIPSGSPHSACNGKAATITKLSEETPGGPTLVQAVSDVGGVTLNLKEVDVLCDPSLVQERVEEKTQYSLRDVVELKGLSRMPELNGWRGEILSATRHAAHGVLAEVCISGETRKLQVKESNLDKILRASPRPPPSADAGDSTNGGAFHTGEAVVLHSLTKQTNLNGVRGVIAEVVPIPNSSGVAFSITLPDGGSVLIREANLSREKKGGPDDGASPQQEEMMSPRVVYAIGDEARIHTLTRESHLRLNGKVGTVQNVIESQKGGQGTIIYVKLPDEAEVFPLLAKNLSKEFDPSLSPALLHSQRPPEWLEEFPIGCKVTLQKLRGTDGYHNARVAVVKKHLIDPDADDGAALLVENEKSIQGVRSLSPPPSPRGGNGSSSGGASTPGSPSGDTSPAVPFSLRVLKKNVTRSVILTAPDSAADDLTSIMQERFSEGCEVVAVGLSSGVNGSKGVLKKTAGGVAWVDFGAPHNLVPILLSNLRREGSVEVEDARSGGVFLFFPSSSGKVMVEVYETGVHYTVSSARVTREGALVVNEGTPSEARMTLPQGISRYIVPQLGRLFFLMKVPNNIPAPNPLAFVVETTVKVGGLACNTTLNGLRGKIVGLNTSETGNYILSVQVSLSRAHGTMHLRPENVVPC